MTDGQIGIRLRFEDSYIIVSPTTEGPFEILISDAIGNPVPEGDRMRALSFLLREISDIRQQVYAAIGGKVS